jgi:hypothetical protein
LEKERSITEGGTGGFEKRKEGNRTEQRGKKKKKNREGRNDLRKETGEVYKEAETEGGFSGPKLENKIILFRFPAAAPLSPPWPSATTIQHLHSATISAATSSNRGETETKQRRRKNKREQKQRGSKAQRKGDHHLHQRSHRLLLQHDRCVSAPREEEQQ